MPLSKASRSTGLSVHSRLFTIISEATYGGIYDAIVGRIGDLTLAPYRLELYKKKNVPHDQFVEGREEALVGIFKSRYLKRFESSIEAFQQVSLAESQGFAQ